MVRAAFPERALIAAEPLAGGLRNSNFKLRFEPGAEPLVLRIYEHDRALCRKEVDLHRLVGGAIPIPEILHAAPDGVDGSAPFVIMRYVEGITFRHPGTGVEQRPLHVFEVGMARARTDRRISLARRRRPVPAVRR